MPGSFRIEVLTPEGAVHEADAASAVFAAHDGLRGILPGHAAMVGALGAGPLRVRPAGGGEEARFTLRGGFYRVAPDRLVLLADGAARAT